ncbi:MAG: YihA family ribosome biogenesis GTP-binding protein [Rhodospirillaceae bacterium]|jgi:GTP-binding protein|nr:YihA family ribosome biogenesis GTP-binding protein [Rhodospirillaceae bacterium]MBT4588453.1 YihA family ribosome biogenesis GTP-binding protein [Rhodospirillaceae bacterium]MBT5939297.1 YihA family ribosome biogenesis GTP-binding protein [Rhodospirillaceae bacterium]MBT7265543.1 YihA family ribosome biogenesis GTP-binding protein [Rhodospirillaceae bacterium]
MELNDQDLEQGRVLFAQNCEFLISAASFEQLPDSELPEIAFAGRSNVGKSSLLNALTGRKNLARTSNTPGRTQQVNFFDLGGRMMLTDLPGYGYARATKSVVEKWTRLIKSYLKGRVQLRRVCLLIDSRHGLKATDHEAMDLMDGAAVAYQIILTKCDKIKASELEKLLEKTHKEIAKHVAAHPEIMVTSSAKSKGIEELRAALTTLANSAAE